MSRITNAVERIRVAANRARGRQTLARTESGLVWRSELQPWRGGAIVTNGQVQGWYIGPDGFAPDGTDYRTPEEVAAQYYGGEGPEFEADEHAAYLADQRTAYAADPDRWLGNAAAELRDAHPIDIDAIQAEVADVAGTERVPQVMATAAAWRDMAEVTDAEADARDNAANYLATHPEAAGDVAAHMLTTDAPPEVVEQAISAGLAWAGPEFRQPNAAEADYEPPHYDSSHVWVAGADREAEAGS